MSAMPALKLDHQRNADAYLLRGTLLLVSVLIILVAAAAYYRSLEAQAEQWEAKAEKLERTMKRGAADRMDERTAADLILEVKRANEVVRELLQPWERLFQAVESAGGKDVALLALEPNPERKTVKIRGEAKDMQALLGYVRRLQDCDSFAAVYLQSHQVQQQEAQKPVRFVLLADWKGLS
jgi:hypothetical protein